MGPEYVDDLASAESTGTGAARSDKLRRRPEAIRYFYMAISASNVHVGSSHGGLKYVLAKHAPIAQLFLADVVSGVVRQVEEPVEDFLARWAANYNDANWDYFAEMSAIRAAAAKVRKR